MTYSNPTIFLSAGEASGEHYGAQVIAQLRARMPGATFFGLGGLEMEWAGLERVVRAEDVAVMGITEVIRHMPRIYREYRRLVAAIRKRRPDVAVLIDFPDVNFRLAKHCKRLGIPVVWFVSPQLWAWKRRRLRWVQERVSRMLVIFPFEAAFYKARGVTAEFVGHPLLMLPLTDTSREMYAARYGLDTAKEWVALLPGSRRKEVRLNLSQMVAAAELLGGNLVEEQIRNTGVLRSAQDDESWSSYEFVLPIASTVGREFVEIALREAGIGAAGSSSVPQNDDQDKVREMRCTGKITLVDDARAAMFHARASVVASGTATVQAALIGNPFVVVYRVSPLTFAVAKRLVRYPPEIPAQVDEAGNLPIAMVNLVAGRRVVPELLQERFTGANVAAALRPLLADGPDRARMIADLAEVRQRLLPPAGTDPIRQVCDAVQSLLR